MYNIYKILAVVFILGTSFPTLGPGLSARRRCMVNPCLLSAVEATAKRNTSTPIPPTQWVKLRQYKMLLDRLSTSGRMDAPVVVKPDTVSNNASIKRGISPEK